MLRLAPIVVLAGYLGCANAEARDRIELPPFVTEVFASEDGLDISADLYIAHPKGAPLIVLFHQAGWSRGEYRAIAPRLNALGYNAIAIDQRSGGVVNAVANDTKKRADKAKKKTGYLDALPTCAPASATRARTTRRAR